MRRSEIVILGLIVVFFAIGAYAYPQMPERMASHWDARGEVDGYSPKAIGVFLMPSIYAALALLFIAIPRIDPLKANIQSFRDYYDRFVILLAAFLLAVHVQVILWNFGIEISPNVLMPVGLGLLFYYVGVLCEHARRNWFVGIRTPWTLSSDRVWDKTHKIGAKLFKAAGGIAILGAFFGSYAVFFIIVPVLLVTAYTVVYSYIEYRKENG